MSSPEAIESIFPTTFAQQGFVLGSLSSPDDALFIEQTCIPLHGPLDLEHLRNAFDHLVRRHDVLRTAFALNISDEPRQVVLSETNLQLQFDDLSGLTATARRQRLDELLERQRQPFDLTRPPLLRLALLHVAAEEHLLVWTHHHAILDGWSQMLLIEEAVDLHNGTELPGLSGPRFGDYALWAREQGGNGLEAAWRHVLAGFEGPPPLQSSPPRDGGDRYTTVTRFLTAGEREALEEFCRENDLTTATAVLGCWGLVIARLRSTTDLAVGVTISGRTDEFAGVVGMVGPCARTVPLRVQVSSGEDFVTWLRGLQVQLAEAIERGHCSTAQIHTWASQPPSRPLHDSVVALANYPAPRRRDGENGAGLRIGVEGLSGYGGRTLQPLSLVATEFGELSLRLTVDRARVDPGTGTDALTALVGLLRGLKSSQSVASVDTDGLKSLQPLGEAEPAGSKQSAPVGEELEGVESQVASAFATALDLAHVGLDDDLIGLGGHSMLAIELLAKLRSSHGVDLTLLDLVSAATPRRVAARIRELSEQAPLPAEELPALVPDPANAHEPFELTDMQQAYWVGRQAGFELGGVDSRIFAALDIEDLDLAKLQGAWRTLVQRHPMLRAVLTDEGTQVVLPRVPDYEIAVTDLRDAGAAGEEALERIRNRLASLRGEPTDWPLFAIEAALLPGGITRLFLSFDLQIGDALSWRVLHRELRCLYENPEAILPSLDLTFRDYVRAQSLLKDTEPYRRSKRYWRARVEDLPGPPRLSLAQAPDELERVVFRRRQEQLDPERTAALRRLAGRLGVTPSTLLLGSYVEVLQSFAESREMLINTTLYNRLPLHPQVECVVGDFTSALLVEVTAAEGPFAERIQILQRQLWRDLEHRYYGGLEVLRELRRCAPVGSAVGAPVVFTSTIDLSGGEAPPVPGRIVDGLGQTPQVALDCQVYELGDELVLIWDSVEGLYPAGMIDAAFDLHMQLLRRLADDEDAADRRRPLDLIRPAGRPSLEPPLGGDALLHQPFVERAEEEPERIAVIAGKERLSYGETLARARATAAAVGRLDAPAGSVAVMMKKGWQQAVGVLGALLSGRPFVPIDPNWPPARIESVARRAGTRVVLTQAGFDRDGLLADLPVVAVDEGQGPAEEMPAPRVDAGDVAYVIFTSGSSGEPKGVVISHRSALNTVLDVNSRFAIGPDDRLLNVSGLTFDLSIYDLFGPLSAGAAVVVPAPRERRDPSGWTRLIKQERVTVWNSVPTLMELLVSVPGVEATAALSSLRLCLMSGDWIPLSLPGRIRACAPETTLVGLGGATEGSIWSILFEIEEVDPTWTSIPYGYAMSGQSVEVLDGSLSPRPPGVPGEIYIGGAGVAIGYLEAAETAAAFVEDRETGRRLYRTGDWGRYRDDGSIELLGRQDDQVKVNGHRVELREVEAGVLSIEGVEQSAALAVGDRSNRRLEVFAVGEVAAPTLRERLVEALPSHLVPARIHVLERLPLTSTGKVDRKRLSALAAEAAPGLAAGEDPRVRPGDLVAEPYQDLVEELAKVAAPYTGLPTQGSTDLLAAGLSSVDVIRLINEVERRYGVRADIEAFYRDPTPNALARAMQRASSGPGQGAGAPSPWASHQILDNREAREEFRRARPQLPPPPERRTLEQLSPLDGDRRHTRRTPSGFSAETVPHRSFSSLLDCLRRAELGGRRAFLYPSAGGLYCVEAWVAVASDRVEGVPAGLYRYHPDAHDLDPLAQGVEIGATHHLGSANDVLAEEAAFTILLGTDPADSAPLYGEEAAALNLLNAGYMGQLLCERASTVGLGLCPLHGFDFEAVKWLFPGEGDAVLLHLLVGGVPSTGAGEG